MNTAYNPNDPAHLRERADAIEAQMNGKPLQYLHHTGQWVDRARKEPSLLEPLNRYRPKPWTLPEPPAGMRWHREDGWREDDLPPGRRPLLLGEKYQNGDEYFSRHHGWQAETHAGGVVSEYMSRCRTTRHLPSLMPGPEYHNPANLNLAQVGEGYRLLTKEEQRECIHLARVHKGMSIWRDDNTWSDADTSGMREECTYRVPINWQPSKPAPQPGPRLWDCAEDVMRLGPVCWLKTPLGNASLILHVAKEGVGTAIQDGIGKFTWKQLYGCEYSTDLRTWQPCHKATEAQP